MAKEKQTYVGKRHFCHCFSSLSLEIFSSMRNINLHFAYLLIVFNNCLKSYSVYIVFVICVDTQC